MNIHDAEIRAAVEADLPQLCALYHAFHNFHAQHLPQRLVNLGQFATYDCGTVEQGLRAIFMNENAAVFVVEQDGRLLGMVEVYVKEDVRDAVRVGGRYGFVQSLMVTASARRSSIGTQLMETAAQWAQMLGAVEIRLETWEFEDGPNRFYEKSGYHTLKRTWVKAL